MLYIIVVSWCVPLSDTREFVGICMYAILVNNMTKAVDPFCVQLAFRPF